jgi:hypothetical protein
MTTYRREVFQPEELLILGSAFAQIWDIVGSELGDIDPTHEVAARKRLANIMVLLARSDDLDAEEIKAMSVRIFRSIEKRSDSFDTPAAFGAGTEEVYGDEQRAT